jgi:deoxyribose-phosphate aldolase
MAIREKIAEKMTEKVQGSERAAQHEALVFHGFSRNQGTGFNLDWVRDLRVNKSAVERRAATLGTRRTVKKEYQAAWLLKAVSCMDLTTLSGDDTPPGTPF